MVAKPADSVLMPGHSGPGEIKRHSGPAGIRSSIKKARLQFCKEKKNVQ